MIQIPESSHHYSSFLAIFFLAAGLGACQNTPTETVAEVEADQQQVIQETAPEVIPETIVEEPAVPAWQYNIGELLAEADAALAADRLMTPIEDNAFDRYNAVLILEPGNAAAIDGLQEIFNRYVMLAQAEIRSGQFGKARALIERASDVNRDSPTLDELLNQIAQRQRERARSRPQVELDPNQKEIDLSTDGLNRRDDAMVEQLQSFAMQVKESDETLLIIARSDAEGRWIYQRMAEGVPGYRLRGDIRLGREPKLLLLPPIE